MKLLSLAILSLLAGCASNQPIEGPVRLGQVAYVGGPRVRADRIIEDSRCPVEVQCVSEGRLIVLVTVLGGGWSQQRSIMLGTPVHVADGSLTLVAATPAKRLAPPSGTPAPYRFTFQFQGGL